MPNQQVPTEFVRALKELDLSSSDVLYGTPLTGGVSSDIWRIETEKGVICAKRALAKLRVDADWQAPVERNQYEALWLQVANKASANCAPQLLGQHPEFGVLIMNYMPPSDFHLWKKMLHDGIAAVAIAQSVGIVLSRIHSYAAKQANLTEQFPTDDIFYQIRLEPYLVATASKHPDLAPVLQALVLQTQSNAKTLVHGDVSPKNILIGKQGPVLLDAECATWSDPAFDLAFCLNHLLLKCLWTPASTSDFLKCFGVLSNTYLQAVDWESKEALEKRTAHLLPGLFLARVDGKSPVEYITDDHQREQVRRVGRALLLNPVDQLKQIALAWAKELAT